MKIFADHYFQIGQQHYTNGKPCQDYATSTSQYKYGFHNASCAIVSDGCSTGGNTDIGARLISLITQHYLMQFQPEIYKAWIGYISSLSMHIHLNEQLGIHGIDHHKCMLGLEHNDLLATCIYIYIDRYDNVIINTQGDGVITIKYKDGELSFYKLEWTNNTPIYPYYYRNEGSYPIWKNEIQYCIPDNAELILTEQNEQKYFIGEKNVKHGYLHTIDKNVLSKIEYIAIFTDGICQIDQVNWKDAVRDFMNFKSSTGEFLKRRMIKQIKEYQKIGKGPLDDIAGAAIYIEED